MSTETWNEQQKQNSEQVFFKPQPLMDLCPKNGEHSKKVAKFEEQA
jgi:hypothetical protein